MVKLWELTMKNNGKIWELNIEMVIESMNVMKYWVFTVYSCPFGGPVHLGTLPFQRCSCTGWVFGCSSVVFKDILRSTPPKQKMAEKPGDLS